jgi:hypothetical protein
VPCMDELEGELLVRVEVLEIEHFR